MQYAQISVAFSRKKNEKSHSKYIHKHENTIDLAGGRKMREEKKDIGKFINRYNNNASKTLNV